MEYKVSPDFTLWCKTIACSEASLSETSADFAWGTSEAATAAFFGGCLAVLADEAEASSPFGETGKCSANTVLPRRLSPRRPFQRRSICAEIPKFSATVWTVSPLRTL